MVTEGDYTLDKHLTGYIDEDNTYICGSGTNELSIDTSSGDVKILNY